jgi:cytochrome c oxidase assembly protein subunit 11
MFSLVLRRRLPRLVQRRPFSGQQKIPDDLPVAVRKRMERFQTQQAAASGGHSAEGFSSRQAHARSLALKMVALAVFCGGLGYASAPLYRMFCQVTGFGGTTQRKSHIKDGVPDSGDDGKESGEGGGGRGAGLDLRQIEARTSEDKKRIIRVSFIAHPNAEIPWKFIPMQEYIDVYPGESALAFFKAKNMSDKAITGVATYNVLPFQTGIYFSKIQCFCFEEQRLRPGEEVDMPVLFYIEPEFLDDPKMKNVSRITLGYTFFKAENDTLTEEDDEEDLLTMPGQPRLAKVHITGKAAPEATIENKASPPASK